jgi:hypothetical protein
MALRGPKNAHPTLLGWVHPKSGELLKAAKLSPMQIAEWWAAQEPVHAPAPQTLHEAPSVERALHEPEIEHHYGDVHTETREEVAPLHHSGWHNEEQ